MRSKKEVQKWGGVVPKKQRFTSIILATHNIKTILIEKQSFKASNKLDLRNIAINPNTYNILTKYNIWDEDILKSRAVNDIYVFNLNDFGLPQRRKRVIAGSYPLDLIKSYSNYIQENQQVLIHNATLGKVIKALKVKKNKIADPNYNILINSSDLIDHSPIDYLDSEEIRINQTFKEYHPVYNKIEYSVDLDEKQYDKIIYFIRKKIIQTNKLIVVGHLAFNRLMKKAKMSTQYFIQEPFYQLISIDYKNDKNKIYKILNDNFKNITYREYYPFFQFFDKSVEL